MLERSVVIRGEPFTVPTNWSDNAAYIAATKYARVIKGKREDSANAMVTRIANAIFHKEDECGKNLLLRRAMLDQEVSFNSPVWFNVGVNPKPVSSACFILGLEDTMESIREIYGLASLVFQNGAGMGVDLSALRERGAPIRGVNGASCGPLLLVGSVLDAIGKATRSGGVTRRAATMLTLKDYHPDAIEFIEAKSTTEDIVRRMGEAGFDVASINAKVYEVIAQQQANRAIRLSDDFFGRVERDEFWHFKSPYYGGDRVGSGIPARAMLRKIAESAWNCGDPGVQFEDTIQQWHTIPSGGPINSSNPCSEFMSIDDSACNLASINLLKFWDGQLLRLNDLRSLVRLMIAAMDRLIEISSFPSDAIADNVGFYRPLGLGFTNLGGLLMAMGISYDSDSGRDIAAALASIITGEGYWASVDVAHKRKTIVYTEMDDDAEATDKVLRKHAHAMAELETRMRMRESGSGYWNTLAIHVDQVKRQLGKIVDEQMAVGNSQISLVAPTGTISFVLDAATTGIEPAYDLFYTKELVQDGTKLVMPLSTIEPALRQKCYSEENVRAALWHVRTRGTLPQYILDAYPELFQTAVGVNTLSPEAHVKMCAAVQPFVSGAISKTVNLPHSATVADFERLIRTSWKSGLKAITFYRDGSKAAQPHTSETPICGACQTPMVQTGTCWSCPSCGEGGVCS